MLASYDLLFLVFVYTGSFAALVIFVILAIIIKHKIAKFSTLVILLVCLYLSLPWWFLTLAYTTKNEEIFHKLAINTSVFPKIKSYMYSNLGSYYYYSGTGEGQKAINCFQKAIDLDRHPEACDVNNSDYKTKCKDYVFSSLVHLCTLYTVKGDAENGVKMCKLTGLTNLAAENYILTDEYDRALNILNEKIKAGKKLHATTYAQRAYVYEKLGKAEQSEKDYETALSLAKGDYKKIIEDIKNNKNYYKNSNQEKKKRYGF